MLYNPAHTAHSEALIIRVQLALLALVMFGVALVCGALLYLGSYRLAGAFVAALVGAVVLFRWPQLGFYGVMGGVLLLDHYQVAAVQPLTGRLPFWQSFSGVSTGALMMIAALLFLTLRRGHDRQRPLLRAGRLLIPCLLLTGMVLFGLYRGMTFYDRSIPRGFDAGAAVNEVSSLLLIPFAYLLALNIVDSPRRLHRLLWVVVVAMGLKTLQMVYTTLSLGVGVFSLREIATHEDSLFLSSLVLLALGLWVYGASRRLRLTTLALLPPVAIALVANHRRAGFVALGLALGICGLMLLADGRLRRWVLRVAPVAAVLLLAYGALFWNDDSPIAYPVYSFRSVFDPTNQKDLSSNVWRSMENINIERTVEVSPVLGTGFGRRYVPWIQEPSIDHSGFTYWRYISHNAIYWVWMKLGVVGFTTFWYLIASAIALGCNVFRRLTDGEMKAAMLMAVGLIAMQMVFSYADLGLTSPRNTIYLGAWIGVIAALDRLAPHWEQGSAGRMSVRRSET